MNADIAIRFVGVAVLIGLNAFFVAIEFAVVASRRTRVEQLVTQGSGTAKIVLGWVESQEAKDKLIAAAQVGITIASLALGYLGEAAVASVVEPLVESAGIQVSGFAGGLLDNLPLIISLLVVTGLHVTLGEQVPKVASLRAPESTAMLLSRWMAGFYWIARPFTWLLDRVAAAILRLLGMQPFGSHSTLYTVDELKRIVEESQERGVLDIEERDMLRAVFNFGELSARQVMVPRTEMVCLPADATLTAASELAAETLLTKFPVYEEDLDHIIGILHSKDLVKAMLTGPVDIPVRDLVREAIFLPESVRVDDVLARFRRRRQHIAILLDEYAGTAGLVTLEDLMEELVGDVQDAFDRPEPQIQLLSETSALVDGLVPIEEVNEAFDVNLDDPNYDTIAGYVLGRLKRIGTVGDEVEVSSGGQPLRFRVEAMDGLRIALLKLEIGKAAPTRRPEA
jgi:CBS domain containing-hemolysin-like protein